MNKLLIHLLKKGLTSPLYIADVGASGGLESHWAELGECVKAILFEPDRGEYEKLKKTSPPENYILINSALSEREEEVEFNICRKQDVSSLYRPNFEILREFPDPERYDILNQIKIKADTLDNQLSKNEICDLDFIKLDTQGHELAILKGAQNILERVIGMKVEVWFISVYENQPLFCQINSFVNGHGFRLFDLYKGYFKQKVDIELKNVRRGQLVLADATYFKTVEGILGMSNLNEEKLIKAITIFLIYGYEDMALKLYQVSMEKGLFSQERARLIDSLLKKFVAKRKIVSFVKNRLYDFLRIRE